MIVKKTFWGHMREFLRFYLTQTSKISKFCIKKTPNVTKSASRICQMEEQNMVLPLLDFVRGRLRLLTPRIRRPCSRPMLWIERKNDINNTQKQHRRLQTLSFLSANRKQDKDKQSGDDSKGTSKTNFLMMVKAIFWRWAFYLGVLPYLLYQGL